MVSVIPSQLRALLTLTEPMSSGFGGGCFILVKMNSGEVVVFDGREEAPAASKNDTVPGGIGGIMCPWQVCDYLGESVAVPGTLSAVMLAHEKYGAKDLFTLLSPVIERAATLGWQLGNFLGLVLELTQV